MSFSAVHRQHCLVLDWPRWFIVGQVVVWCFTQTGFDSIHCPVSSSNEHFLSLLCPMGSGPACPLLALALLASSSCSSGFCLVMPSSPSLDVFRDEVALDRGLVTCAHQTSRVLRSCPLLHLAHSVVHEFDCGRPFGEFAFPWAPSSGSILTSSWWFITWTICGHLCLCLSTNLSLSIPLLSLPLSCFHKWVIDWLISKCLHSWHEYQY